MSAETSSLLTPPESSIVISDNASKLSDQRNVIETMDRISPIPPLQNISPFSPLPLQPLSQSLPLPSPPPLSLLLEENSDEPNKKINPVNFIKPNFLAGVSEGGGVPNSTSSLGGIALGLTGAGKFLKSTKRATTFVLKDGSKLAGNHTDWNITPKDRMRNIDELRRHVPTPDECELLNVPGDRLLVDNIRDVLYLSGGCAGVRFTSVELKSIQDMVSNIQDLCKILEKTYHKLSSEQTKLNINPSCHEVMPKTTDASGNNIVPGDNVKVIYFHGVADDLTRLISQLQRVVHEKQQTIDKTASKMKFDADPDNLARALPRPRWLDILMNKCDNFLNSSLLSEERNAENGESSASSTFTKSTKKFLSKGKLAAFISFCLVGQVSVNSEEREALEEVIQASNDVKVIYCSGDNWIHTIQKQPREYWAGRIYEFLKKISEIKTMPADETSLKTFQI